MRRFIYKWLISNIIQHYYNYKNKSLIRDKVDQADYIERLSKKFGYDFFIHSISSKKISSLSLSDHKA